MQGLQTKNTIENFEYSKFYSRVIYDSKKSDGIYK